MSSRRSSSVTTRLSRAIPTFRTSLALAMASACLLAATLPAAAANVRQEAQTEAQLADVAGPGQAVQMPGAQCPRTVACQYAERNLLPDGYRLQSLQVCGANCTTQYWVSARNDGQLLVEIDPVRGGAVVAVGRGSSGETHPPVRVVLPSYTSSDPACCPSAFADTTYSWDASAQALVAGEPAVTAASDFPGWDAVRQELLAEGWLLAGV
jgi:hypothetical protein